MARNPSFWPNENDILLPCNDDGRVFNASWIFDKGPHFWPEKATQEAGAKDSIFVNRTRQKGVKSKGKATPCCAA